LRRVEAVALVPLSPLTKLLALDEGDKPVVGRPGQIAVEVAAGRRISAGPAAAIAVPAAAVIDGARRGRRSRRAAGCGQKLRCAQNRN
jgi:hypothetical protein